MKKILFAVLLSLTFVSNAQNIGVLYAFRTYHLANTNYAEINTSIKGASLRNSRNSSGQYQKQAELTTVICPAEKQDSVIYVDKRIIKTPLVEDSSSLNDISLLDMQRVALNNGTYVVSFELKDMNTIMQPMFYRDALMVNYTEDINLADIMIVDKYEKTIKDNIFSKCGYDLQPYMFDVIGKDMNNIYYYTEVYNADKVFGKDSAYVVRTIIEDINTNNRIDDIQRIKRFKAQDFTPYLSAIDLSSLAEGSYYLTVEIRDAENILHAYKRYPFFKQSDIKVIEQNVDIPKGAFVNTMSDSVLKEHIKSLRPIASDNQLQYVLKEVKTSDPAQDRYFIYQFYKSINPSDPEKAWSDYTKNVAYVNDKFSTPIKKGYDTDMGRVYLAYGAPDNIIDEKFSTYSGTNTNSKFEQRMNPDVTYGDTKGVTYYPYQIWVYNHTPFGESSRKFVFYAKQDNLSEYFLLHSNARGELQDFYWENVLSHGSLERGIVGRAGKQYERGY